MFLVELQPNKVVIAFDDFLMTTREQENKNQRKKNTKSMPRMTMRNNS